jgi:hypothetical protein
MTPCTRCRVYTKLRELVGCLCFECYRTGDYPLKERYLVVKPKVRLSDRKAARVQLERDLYDYFNWALSDLGQHAIKLEFSNPAIGRVVDPYGDTRVLQAMERYRGIYQALLSIGHQHSRVLERYFTQHDYPTLGLYFHEYAGVVDFMGGGAGIDARKVSGMKVTSPYIEKWVRRAKRAVEKAMELFTVEMQKTHA